jgi:dihydrofolate reductase
MLKRRSPSPGRPVTTVVFDVSLSLDGFIATEGGRPGQPLGVGGDRLREWATGPDAHRAPRPAGSAGALICGRRTYATSLPEWGASGPHPPTPVFVVTQARPAQPPSDSVYTFITGGIEVALEQAREAAGRRDVRIMGGAAVARQFLAAGLVDELVVHLVPVLLKRGLRMFDDLDADHVDLEVIEVVDTPAVTHLRYRLTRDGRSPAVTDDLCSAGEPERALVERVLGEAVTSVRRAAWGFTNRADIVTLADDERVVLQRYRRRSDADRRLRVTPMLATPAAEAGIALPHERASDLDAEPPWVIFNALPGVPVPDLSEAGLEDPRFRSSRGRWASCLPRSGSSRPPGSRSTSCGPRLTASPHGRPLGPPRLTASLRPSAPRPAG